jgi:hypothetical protein
MGEQVQIVVKKVVRKRKMKEDDYDKDDGFVDDSELLWEEQAAAADGGFFVYSGPLVPEGEKPTSDARYLLSLYNIDIANFLPEETVPQSVDEGVAQEADEEVSVEVLALLQPPLPLLPQPMVLVSMLKLVSLYLDLDLVEAQRLASPESLRQTGNEWSKRSLNARRWDL